MLASFGQLHQYFFRINDPVFSEGDKPFKALSQVIEQRPLAVAQVLRYSNI
jgi:hypothetical protein